MVDYWKKFCDIQRYAFFRGENSVDKVPLSTGNHIEVSAAEELVDEMNTEIQCLRSQLDEKEMELTQLKRSRPSVD